MGTTKKQLDTMIYSERDTDSLNPMEIYPTVDIYSKPQTSWWDHQSQ